MSVMVVLMTEQGVSSFVELGYSYALARKVPLCFVLPRYGEECSGPECVPCEGDPNAEVCQNYVCLNLVREAIKACRAKYQPKVENVEPVEVLVAGSEKSIEKTDTAAAVAKALPELDIEIRTLTHSDCLHAILREVTACHAGLLIVPKHPAQEGFKVEAQLARNLIQKAPCHTLLLRADSYIFPDEGRIIVPTAGGPHARVALKLAEQLVSVRGGTLCAVFIAPKIDEESQVAFEHLLESYLKKAGVALTDSVKPKVICARTVSEGIGIAASDGFDLMFVGDSNLGNVRRILFGTTGDTVLKSQEGMSVGVIRAGKPLVARLGERIEAIFDLAIPQMTRQERIQLFETLNGGSRWNFDFLTLIGLSTAIAALGLVQNSAAVVIGAMLVAPLMTPLLGAALSLVQANKRLILMSGKAILFGFLTALSIGFLIGRIVSPSSLTLELSARGGPNLLDLMVAFLSGIAAAYCMARPKLSPALAGVAIAAALVPPVATTGISLAMRELMNAMGSALLFATNVVAIILGAAFSFYAGGVRGNKGQKRGNLWAQRTLSALLLLSVICAIPLATVFVSKVVPQVRPEEQLPEGVFEKINEKLNAEIDGCIASIEQVVGPDGSTLYRIQVEGVDVPDFRMVHEISDLIQAGKPMPIRVELETRLIQRSIFSTAPPK